MRYCDESMANVSFDTSVRTKVNRGVCSWIHVEAKWKIAEPESLIREVKIVVGGILRWRKEHWDSVGNKHRSSLLPQNM